MDFVLTAFCCLSVDRFPIIYSLNKRIPPPPFFTGRRISPVEISPKTDVDKKNIMPAFFRAKTEGVKSGPWINLFSSNVARKSTYACPSDSCKCEVFHFGHADTRQNLLLSSYKYLL